MLKRIISGLSAVVLSISSLFVFAPVLVSAAADTCTWTGGGDGTSFSDGANWSGCDNGGVPESGDSLVFDRDGATNHLILDNDIVGATFAGISVTGSSNGWGTTIEGETFTLAGNISVHNSHMVIDVDVVLAANFEKSGEGHLTIGSEDGETRSLTQSTHSITLTQGSLSVTSDISGSGTISNNSEYHLILSGDNSLFTGSIEVNLGSFSASGSTSLGDSASGTTVADGAKLSFDGNTEYEINEPITIGGGSADNAALNLLAYGGCNGKKVTLTGTLTLTKDLFVGGDVNCTLEIAGTINGEHKISVQEGSQLELIISSKDNNSETPSGTVEPKKTTVTIEPDDKDENATVIIGKNQTYVINGVRGYVSVSNGGVLKGSGQIATISLSDGGILAPGQSPGCLTTENIYDQGEIQVEIGGTTACEQYDQLIVTGSDNDAIENDVVLFDEETDTENTSLLNISFLDDYLPVAGDKFTIINNQGDTAVLGTFNGLAEGATVTSGEVAFQISYVGGDGNDVVLTVISSPNTGFGLLSANPVVTFMATITAAGAIILLGRRYKQMNT